MATEIKIKNIPTGFQSIITNGTHTIIGDEPIKSKGTDLGFAPTELVLAGLGMCKVATVRYIARKNGWEIRDVDASLKQKVRRNPDRSLSPTIEVEIKIEGELSTEQERVLLEEADNCYVHRLIEGNWNIGKAQKMTVSEESTID